MNRSSLARLLSAVILLSACVGRPAADATGAEIYGQLCARCHGAALGGGVGPALGPDSALSELDDVYLDGVLRNGRGSMPAFGSTLDDAQIDRLMTFIREEQGP